MPVTLAEVREGVLAETNRPKTPITLIDRRILNSIAWIEKRWSFEWMSRFVGLTLLANSTKAGPYAMPPNYKEPRLLRLKAIEATGVGSYRYIRRVDPEDLVAVKLGDPLAYWIDGVQWMWFSAVPEANASVELLYYAYTGTMGPGDTHWLFDHGRPFVEAKTMQYLCPYLRMPEVMQMYQGIAQDEYMALAEDDERRKQAGLDLVLGMWEDGHGR